MKETLTSQIILESVENKPWDFANQVLYDLCKKHPKHDEDEVIIAKVWLIGRSYSAAIERFKREEPKLGLPQYKGDDFYTKAVVPTFKNEDLDLDSKLNELKRAFKNKTLSKENIEKSLKLHWSLTEQISGICDGQKQRSLVSKYLHFHVPAAFFIYDQRVTEALASQKIKLPDTAKLLIEKLKDEGRVDIDYASFCVKCLCLISEIEKKYPIVKIYSTRHLDNILIRMYEAKFNLF